MIALGLFLILNLFALNAILSKPDHYLQVHFDGFSLIYVFCCILLHVALFGRKKFFRGLSALIRLPKQGDQEIADYFSRLSFFTLLIGVVSMTVSSVASVYLIRYPDIVGQFFAWSIFPFFYAGWISVMLFLPISLRYGVSTGIEPAEPKIQLNFQKRFPFGSTFLSIAAFFLTRGLMAILLITMMYNWSEHSQVLPTTEAVLVLEKTFFSLNPGDPDGNTLEYLNPTFFWDSPSMLVILLSVWAFYLAAGPVRNRMLWIPLCILFGVLWSLEGFTMMLSDLDPDKLAPGCMVTLLTTLYGFFAAFCVLIGIGGYVLIFFSFLTLLAAVIALPATGYWLLYGGGQMTSFDLSLFVYAYTIAFFIGVVSIRATIDYFRRRRQAAPVKPTPETSPESEEQAQRLLDSVVEKERRS